VALTYGSFCSGIGGLDLGLERAGWGCLWQVELSEFCHQILARHWPDVARYGDLRSFRPEEVPAPEALVAGFPCQPVTHAGQRLAEADPRWLWPEIARCIRVLRPRYVLLENVPGLLARGMASVLGDLADCGFDAAWDCLPAAALGASHLRDRLFIFAVIADADGQRCLERWCEVRAWKRQLARGSRWPAEPAVERVVYGLPGRVDRVRGLGNAVAPPVAEAIGSMITEAISSGR